MASASAGSSAIMTNDASPMVAVSAATMAPYDALPRRNSAATRMAPPQPGEAPSAAATTIASRGWRTRTSRAREP
jgi:hypothetical protein